MRNLRIAPCGLGELLANNEFIVPTYQRSFAWTDDHVKSLLTDLSGAMKRFTTGKGDAYFLGTIVVIERTKTKSLEVVDGQQRLATTSIFLAAIRDYHLKISKDRAAASYDLYLRTHHIPTGKHHARLRLNEVDDRCFSRMIVEQPAKRQQQKWSVPSHKRILGAYQCCVDFIESIAGTNSPKNTIEFLFQMTEFIKSNAQVIKVVVDDEADAFTIFETMNDRHVYLTVADLLKNFLFGTSGDQIDTAKGNWREMQGVLGSLKGKKDRTVDFIRQQWGSMHGLVREKELFRDIKNKVTDEDDAIELSAVLAQQASDYVAVLNPLHEMWDGYGNATRHALETFNTLRVERIRPLLLAILYRFNKDEVVKALCFLRSAAVRIVVTSGISGSVEELIFQIAAKVHHREITKASQLAKTMQFVPSDTVFKSVFATINVTKTTLARFYLQEIQDAATDVTDDERVIDRDEKRVDLEHIIPLAASERQKHWPELSADLGAALCKRLGNQTLMSKKQNSSLNGKSFSEKLKAYALCRGIALTHSISRDYTTFGEEQVNARQAKLADLAVLAWPIKVGK